MYGVILRVPYVCAICVCVGRYDMHQIKSRASPVHLSGPAP